MTTASRAGWSIGAVSAWLSVLALVGCGTFSIDNSSNSGPGGGRRVYVNDSAANDSLRGALVREGVRFVLQPGKAYEFAITTDRTADKLDVYYTNSGFFETVLPTLTGQKEVFPIASDQASARFFTAQLEVPDGLASIDGLKHVQLVSLLPGTIDTLKVHLFFIRKLANLTTSSAKDTFARNLFANMAAIYSPYGIVLQGTYEIVEPDSPRMVFPFSNTFVSLPGTPMINNVNFYLVDSISIGDPGSGLTGEVLGFAPREVVDLDTHRESRVLLSNQAAISRLAITAAHEMGHFFGLRHTVSTLHDFLQDDDFTNTEDGFKDTPFCHIDQAVAKRSLEEQTRGPHTMQYCLRIADNSCSVSSGCDLTNLMHPVDCSPLRQTVLSGDQVAFLRKNLALYRH